MALSLKEQRNCLNIFIMSNHIVYRLLTIHDAERYHQIRLECLRNHPDHFGSTYEEEMDIETTRFIKELTEENNHSFWFGAFDAEKLVGIAGFVQQKRLKTRHRGELVQVYVHPSMTHKGIGKELLTLTIDQAFSNTEIEQIFLSVVESNNKAVALYKKFGFVECGFIENYFKKDGIYSSQVFMVLPKLDFKDFGNNWKERTFNEFLLKLRSLYNRSRMS